MEFVKKHINIAIITALAIVSMIGLYNKYNYGVPVVPRNYLAYAAIIALVVLILMKSKHVKTVLGLTLFVGSLNLIQFTHSDIAIKFHLGNTDIFGFQPLSMTCLILFAIFNWKWVKEKLIKLIVGLT